MSKYTSKTKEFLRETGWLEWTVERYIYAIQKRIDLYNCIDIIAICPQAGKTLGVQSCPAAGRSNHRETLINSGLALAWVLSGNGLWLMDWRLSPKVRGGKQKVWTHNIEVYQKEDFAEKAWTEYKELDCN